MLSKISQLTWSKPNDVKVRGGNEGHRSDRTRSERDFQSPLGTFLWNTGLPSIRDPAATPKQTAVMLLQSAAEVEHAFVLQYLFAAYSLRTDDVNASDWSSKLHQIAREEMGHLVTVQNLLALLGQPPHLDRQAYPAPADYKFEKMLRPFSLSWLGDFVIAESPLNFPLPPPLDMSSSKMAHVGAIYAHLYWLFQPSDTPLNQWPMSPLDNLPSGEHLSDSDFVDPTSIGDLLLQPSDWGVFGTIRVLGGGPFADVASCRTGALNAIFDVASQGEGTLPQQNSHFERLLALFTTASSTVGDLPVKHVTQNPHTSPQSTGDDGLITDPTALRVAHLLNLRYWMLITEIAHSASVRRGDLADGLNLRATLATGAKQDMRAVDTLSKALTLLPLKQESEGGSTSVSCPPFELPGSFPTRDDERWQLYLQVIDETAQSAAQLGTVIASLAGIAESDSLRRPFIQKRLGK